MIVSLAPPVSVSDIERLKGWMPVRVLLGQHLPIVTWRDMRNVIFNEPFFRDTVGRIEEAQGSDAFIATGLDELLLLQRHVEFMKPSGFIFHVSRCGSTLVARSLQALEKSVVIREAQPVETAVWLHFAGENIPKNHSLLRSVILQSVVNVMGQRSTGVEQNYFIKFSSWDILQIEQIRRIWPEVPWLFITRDPVEVIVSNLRKTGQWLQCGNDFRQAAFVAGVTTEYAAEMSTEEYCARAIGRFCETALDFVDEKSLFVDYKELSVEMIKRIIRFFGFEPSQREIQEIERVSKFYSKDITTERPYSDDSAHKQAAAAEQLRFLADRLCTTQYNAAYEYSLRQAAAD
jgi:hypothetical protein